MVPGSPHGAALRDRRAAECPLVTEAVSLSQREESSFVPVVPKPGCEHVGTEHDSN